MTDEGGRPPELSSEELEAQAGEELPERQAMSVLDPGDLYQVDPIPRLSGRDTDPFTT